MPEEFTPRIGRKAAQTNLTDGESRAIDKLQVRMQCRSRADLIRTVLTQRLRAEGLLI